MLISIVVPSFNQAKWLRSCLSSITAHQGNNLQLIVMDGGSTDGSVEIIRSFEQDIHYWQSQPDGGQYHAIHDGLQRATGDVFAWLNADDLFLPWTLSTVSSLFRQLPKVEWVTSIVPTIVSANGQIFQSGPCRPVSREAFLDGYYIPGDASSLGVLVQEGTFWRRDLWERTKPRFTADAPLAGDFELWSRFFCSAEVYNLGLPLAAMTRHEFQRSNAATQYTQECRAVLAKTRSVLGLPEQPGLLSALTSRGYRHGLTRRLSRLGGLYQINSIYPKADPSGLFESWETQRRSLS